MQTLNITELKKWAKDNSFKDSWWVSVNGVTIDSPIKLGEVPKEGDVLLLNVSSQGTDKEEWIAWHYPGYKTEAEKIEKIRREKISNFLAAKRILELEYAEKNQGITRNEAIVLQNENNLSPDNYGMSWPHEFGHGMAKLSYGAWERESVISSWMIHQEGTGIDREIGKPKRRAEHATKRSVVECEDRSVGFPISARQRGHAA